MAQWTWPDLITGLINGRDLDDEAGAWAMDQLLTGRTSPEQMSGFLVALRSKGETSGELSALSKGMLSKALPLELPREAVDIVGTGGDRANTVNVSTMASIVTAASGRPVIKHGNRAASSMCGTAECLEALGVVIDPDDELFASPGDMPAKIARWCRDHYAVEPEGPAQTVRLILESLACAHAAYAQGLQDVVGDLLDPASPIHLVGGGARNSLLPAMTAAACNRRVVVGTPEASALGNILAQLEATGAVEPASRGEVLRRSARLVDVEPTDSIVDPSTFDAMRERLLNVTTG